MSELFSSDNAVEMREELDAVLEIVVGHCATMMEIRNDVANGNVSEDGMILVAMLEEVHRMEHEDVDAMIAEFEKITGEQYWSQEVIDAAEKLNSMLVEDPDDAINALMSGTIFSIN